jgi:hypothetical protein
MGPVDKRTDSINVIGPLGRQFRPCEGKALCLEQLGSSSSAVERVKNRLFQAGAIRRKFSQAAKKSFNQLLYPIIR